MTKGAHHMSTLHVLCVGSREVWISIAMQCTGCGFELTSDFAFCPRCGRSQPAPCLACGAACEAAFAFCPRCGAARAGSLAPGSAIGPGPHVPGRPRAPGGPTPDRHGVRDGAALHEADRRLVTVL